MAQDEILEFYYGKYVQDSEKYYSIVDVISSTKNTANMSNISKQCKKLWSLGFLIADPQHWKKKYKLNPHRWRTVRNMLKLDGDYRQRETYIGEVEQIGRS